jgi:drug/metabolite transporter (DMT)-like permease
MPTSEIPTEHVPRVPDRHIKTFVSILIMIVLSPLGNVLLRKGMRDIIDVPTTWMASAAHVLSSGTIWLGIVCLMGYVFAEMLVLSWADYSYVQPVTASAYGVAAVLGHVMLGEDVSRLRWLGIGVICLGVLMVGRTSSRTTEERRA